ncbi:uncharacterized protein LOC101163803 isoform X1 [Oryzias latipes]|uniref:uncharacterized protein LOC101163803 isoform X1 n=1 Tax=Oryzias latipes TaxID=8090 RepID=UPI0005CC0D2D|nr:uncharacterized protein LOC101163803 isoform X1 [Oryzias latipes]
MSSVEFLREFISERLDAAAERILARYERTVEEYEEKSERRRRQTDISWSPDQVQPPALVPCRGEMSWDDPEAQAPFVSNRNHTSKDPGLGHSPPPGFYERRRGGEELRGEAGGSRGVAGEG